MHSCPGECVGSHPGGGSTWAPGGEANLAGSGQVAGTSRGGQGRAQGWEKSSGRKVPWLVSEGQLAGELWMSPILADTQPHGHSLSVSNYDKWQWVRVAGRQLPHLRGKQVFLALCLWGSGSGLINHGEQHEFGS